MISLSVTGLDLDYGAAQALKGVSLEVRPGAITCVLGRNGVGKSSLLRAIMGLEKVRSGSVAIDGTPIDSLAPDARVRACDWHA